MELTRRDFLKLTGASIGGVLLSRSGAGMLWPEETFYYNEEKIEPDYWKKAVCRYCGTGCGQDIGVKDGKVLAIRGTRDYPVNKGNLCLKGLSLMHVVHSDERAFHPYVKNGANFEKVSMDAALDAVANKINETVQKHGPDSVALYVGAQLFTEEMFIANKLFKGVIGTNNVEANARLCMASAVTGFLTTFGLDEPPGSYADIEHSDCFFLIGSNLAEQHPVIFARLLQRKAENPNFRLIVADPRFTPTAAHADIWLPFFPGTDMALLNSLAYVLVKNGYVDHNFLEQHITLAEGGAVWGEEKKISFEEYERFLEDYAPEKVAAQVGVKAEEIIAAGKMFGDAEKCMSMWTMGLNQRKWGTWVNNLMYNLHFLTGKICTPGNTALSMTGQPNACGGVREQGMLAHVLPSHRGVKNPKHREEMEEIWGVPKGSISPNPGPHTVKMFDQLGEDIKLIWIVCSNPAQTMPDLNKYLPKFEKAFVIVQDIFPPTQVQPRKFRNVTAEYADIFLPSAFWIEKGGVFGNTERRNSYTEKILDAPNGLLGDGDIFQEVARRMGHGHLFTYKDMEEVWKEYQKGSAGTDLDVRGASYEFMLNNGGAQWPILSEEEGDSPYRYRLPEDKFLKHLVEKGEVTNTPDDNIYFYGKPDGKARLFKRPHMDPAEMPDAEYPFYLTTGRVVHHWHSGTMTMRTPWLKKMVPDAFIEMNIHDATRLGIRNHDKVKITSRRGEIVLKAKIVDTRDKAFKGVEERVSIPRPGVVFAPFFDADKLVNLVCIDAVDDMSKEPEYKICAVRLEKV